MEQLEGARMSRRLFKYCSENPQIGRIWALSGYKHSLVCMTTSRRLRPLIKRGFVTAMRAKAIGSDSVCCL